jgi:hypothetical protein
VTGNVTTREGTVRVGPETEIRGDVAGEYVEVHREAEIEGAIRATEEMSMVSEPVLDDSVVETSDAADDDADATAADETAGAAGDGAETTGDTVSGDDGTDDAGVEREAE